MATGRYQLISTDMRFDSRVRFSKLPIVARTIDLSFIRTPKILRIRMDRIDPGVRVQTAAIISYVEPL